MAVSSQIREGLLYSAIPLFHRQLGRIIEVPSAMDTKPFSTIMADDKR
jgi:hypothetical protein